MKSAEKLFENHEQPRVPFEKNYYNLLDKDTICWQESLLKKYHVHGLCFYHYWFKDGKKVLQKPGENLLKWKEIDIPFCFCWANESWVRTWSKLEEGNVWAGRFEGEKNAYSTGILIEQKYGDKSEWKKHFDYLLPFFEDHRYIRINNKPIFVIYKPEKIPALYRMIKYWRELAVENALDGIYVIGINAKESDAIDAVLIREPQYTITQDLNKLIPEKRENGVHLYLDGEKIWDQILERNYGEEKVYLGGFTGYDDTPRRGAKGTVVGNLNEKKFYDYMKKLLQKSSQMGNEYLFLNAWNEWGEGMYLEPDGKNLYAYLEAVEKAQKNYKTQKICFEVQPKTISSVKKQPQDVELAMKIERYRGYWTLLDKWLYALEQGKKLETFFLERGYKSIALYGYGMLGMHIADELKNSSVKIVYMIDQNKDSMKEAVPVYKKEEDLPEVDAVIVTVFYYFKEIYKYMNEKVTYPIISIEEVLEEWI